MSEPTKSKLEYDSTLGGPVELDTHVQTYKYAGAALDELSDLYAEVENPSPGTKLVFQTLPKNMRRRAMSHQAKRLPRKYRHIHTRQMEKTGKAVTGKRPSRKYRRRPRQLMLEYRRRQRRIAWLETHIWHARRFHMVDKWGYRLPYASCDKTLRASYRASAKHCLLQDISYYACVQLEGNIDVLSPGLECITAPYDRPHMSAVTYISGLREGSKFIYRKGEHPYGCLGRIRFMWRPAQNESSYRTLWMWVHPSMYTAFVEELIKLFALKPSNREKIEVNASLDPEHVPDVDHDAKYMTKIKAIGRIPHYRNAANNVQLSELKGKLNRFRLTGPLSHAVLQCALKAKSTPQADEGDGDNATNPTTATATNWFTALVHGDAQALHNHKSQASYWQRIDDLQSPSELPSNQIIALNADDPRIHRPAKRTKAESVFRMTDRDLLVSSELQTVYVADSRLWDLQTRVRLLADMMSPRDYCQLREKQATVPGGRCQFEGDMQPVPLLLVQRPGSDDPVHKRLGYGCGWDVIVPPGYGMIVWLSLIMWGAKPGGLRQMEIIAREMGTEQFEADTVAGVQRAAEQHLELRANYFGLPPNKRLNYCKLSIVSPFRAPFRALLRDWAIADLPDQKLLNRHSAGFYVLRDNTLLEALDLCIYSRRPFPDAIPDDCLIPVNVALKTRGVIRDNALICLPTPQDSYDSCQRYMLKTDAFSLEEQRKADPNERKRKQLRKQHKRQLKRLRARRVRQKRKEQESSARRVHIQPAGTSKLVAEHLEKMRKLWLPENVSEMFSVRKQCSRQVIGYVTCACFMHTDGRMHGVGYVTAKGLRDWMSTRYDVPSSVLVRDTQSRHYHFAWLNLR